MVHFLGFRVWGKHAPNPQGVFAAPPPHSTPPNLLTQRGEEDGCGGLGVSAFGGLEGFRVWGVWRRNLEG